MDGHFALTMFATALITTVAVVTAVVAGKAIGNALSGTSLTFPAKKQLEVPDLTKTKSKAEAKAKTKTKVTSKVAAASKAKDFSSSINKKIYRYGGTNPGNFVPSSTDVKLNSGLSFSTIPKLPSAVTTIDELNRTGKVIAIMDSATHVSVYPINGTLNEWRVQGTTSIWTQAIKSVVVKWDGTN